MYFKLIFTLFFVIGCYGDSDVEQAFLDSGIVPNIETVAPNALVNVSYPTVDVYLGNNISPLQTLVAPNVTYPADEDRLYTYVFMGPDLPLDLTPRYTQFLHNLIINIPGSNIDNGQEIVVYFPPTPYPLGLTYQFFVYLQSGIIDDPALSSRNLLRPQFDVVEFKTTYNLTGPVAGNFMRQTYVPEFGV